LKIRQYRRKSDNNKDLYLSYCLYCIFTCRSV